MEINSSQFDPGSGFSIVSTNRDKPKNQTVQPVPERSSSDSGTDAAIVLRKGNEEAFERADRFREQQTFRESYDGRSADAIHAYTSLMVENKRAEIHGMLGVDTYV